MTKIRIWHASMQYSDSKTQRASDVAKIFTEAKRRNVAWVTGTEAGADDFSAQVRAGATKAGYTYTEYKGNWVAVRRSLIASGYRREVFTVVDNDLTVGRGHDTSLLAVHFNAAALGRVRVLASHYPRFGRPDSKDPQYRRNLRWTRKIAGFIGTKAMAYGKGAALVFYGGDQNIPDNRSDTFFGAPLTSCWDELRKWPNTGHGNIDVIASYDRDLRVKCIAARAFNDTAFRLNTDHFLIEAIYEVAALK